MKNWFAQEKWQSNENGININLSIIWQIGFVIQIDRRLSREQRNFGDSSCVYNPETSDFRRYWRAISRVTIY